MGYLAAVKRFLEVMAMVWVGSQVTKLVRAGGALALAPTVDRGLSWFTVKFKFDSQVKQIGGEWLLSCAFWKSLFILDRTRYTWLGCKALSRHRLGLKYFSKSMEAAKLVLIKNYLPNIDLSSKWRKELNVVKDPSRASASYLLR